MKRLVILLSIMILLLNTINLVTSQKIENNLSGSYENIIFIDDDNIYGPWDGTIKHPYRNINDGIFNSTEGDLIYVFNGTYYENVTIYKKLTLEGENKTSTIIDGLYQENVILVTIDNVNIKNFTIRNSGGYKDNAGIKLDSNNNIIEGCKIYRTKTGVHIQNSNNNQINSCLFHTNGEGIYIQLSKNCKVEESCLYHNGLGLNIQDSSDIKINTCYEHTSGLGFLINDSSNINISTCAVYDNNDNGAGLFITNCENIEIFNCNIVHNGHGLNFYDSSNNLILNSDFIWNAHLAIKIGKNTCNTRIENCKITESFRFGIIGEKSRFKLRNNNMYENLFGIIIERSLCDARKNWWGSSFGPALLHRGVKDRFYFKLGFIRFFPWLLRKNEEAGSDWKIDYEKYPNEINLSRFKQIELLGNDTDNDLVPDWWEKKWGYDPESWDDHKNLDPDYDGLNNIEECYTDQWQSNPFHRDIFIEYDWIESGTSNKSSNKPSEKYNKQLIKVFSDHDITLHPDNGSLGGGEMIPLISEFSMADLRDMYWDYFLHNDLNNPRKGIFHWCLVSDYGPYPGLPGFAVVGWDHLDSFEISAQRLDENHPLKNKGYIIASITMHELGHNLGLVVDDFLGIDNNVAKLPFALEVLKIRRYKSCMNYLYTYWILDYSDGSRGRNDFDDWSNIDFAFFKNTHFEWPKS